MSGGTVLGTGLWCGREGLGRREQGGRWQHGVRSQVGDGPRGTCGRASGHGLPTACGVGFTRLTKEGCVDRESVAPRPQSQEGAGDHAGRLGCPALFSAHTCMCVTPTPAGTREHTVSVHVHTHHTYSPPGHVDHMCTHTRSHTTHTPVHTPHLLSIQVCGHTPAHRTTHTSARMCIHHTQSWAPVHRHSGTQAVLTSPVHTHTHVHHILTGDTEEQQKSGWGS